MKNGPELWDKLLSELPESAIIAGGCVRDFIFGGEPKDIDIWLSDADMLKVYWEIQPAKDDRPEYDGGAITYIWDYKVHGFDVQLVFVPGNVLEFLETFDLSTSKARYRYKLVCDPDFMKAWETKTVTILKTKNYDRSLERAKRVCVKYPDFTLTDLNPYREILIDVEAQFKEWNNFGIYNPQENPPAVQVVPIQ